MKINGQHTQWSEAEERRLKWGLIAFLLAILGGIHLLDPTFYGTIWHLSMVGDFHGTVEYLRGFGVWAMAVSFFIDVIINIVGFLPSIFLSAANGLIFGIWLGILISWAGETVGVLISFWLMRTIFRDMAKRVIEHNKMLTKLDSYSTMWAMLIARAVPYSPNGLVTALGALSHISYRDYLIGTALGKLPSVAIEVIVGHDVVLASENQTRLMVMIAGITIVYGGLWWWKRKKDQRDAARQAQEEGEQDDAEK